MTLEGRIGTSLKAGLALAIAVSALVATAPVEAHNASGIRARIIPGTIRADHLIAVAWGKLRVTNRRVARPGRVSDVIGCRIVVHTAAHRDITAGRATQPWDAVGRVRRGRTRVIGFQVNWWIGEPADHIHLGHCHVPWLLN